MHRNTCGQRRHLEGVPHLVHPCRDQFCYHQALLKTFDADNVDSVFEQYSISSF